MRLIKFLGVFFMFMFNISCGSSQNLEQKVLFCYGDFMPKQIQGYDLIVLESAHFSAEDIQVLKMHNQKVLGYISLGEVNENASHYPILKEFTLGKNELWDSYYLNLSNAETRKSLFNIFQKNLDDKGLDGMFLDNIDNFTKFGPTPEHKPELISFLAEVKQTYPSSYLIQNAGGLIIKDTAPYIDAIAVESVATNYDFKNNRYRLRDKTEFLEILNTLKEIHRTYQKPIIFIEYAQSKKLYDKVLKRIGETDWPYFVGQIDLQKVPKFN